MLGAGSPTRLQDRMVALFAVLLLTVQLASFYFIRYAIETTAENTMREELTVVDPESNFDLRVVEDAPEHRGVAFPRERLKVFGEIAVIAVGSPSLKATRQVVHLA